MTDFLFFDEIGDGDLGLAGGKGLSLARLSRAGFTVPPGFVVTTAAAARSDAGFADGLDAAYGRLAPDGSPVAVRSSAVDEDSAGASFAGQHATILDVRREGLADAVAACRESLHSESAQAYRARSGSGGEEATMAVVVQRMVPAEAAGVAFTADPLTGDTSRVVVEAVRGLGEGLVNGTVEADRYVFDRAELILLERHHPGPVVLDDTMAREVARQALAAEAHFGPPQDIEFAIAGGTPWMLQSRPITAVAAEGEVPGEFDSETTDDDLWTSANIGEVLPGMLTPLAISVFGAHAHDAYVGGYQRLKMLGKDEAPRFVGYFYNRAFLHVGNTRLIAERALVGDADAIEHRFLGGEYKLRTTRLHSWRTWKHRLLSAWPLARLTMTIHRRADEANRETLALEARVRADIPATMTDAELEARRLEIGAFVSRTFEVHLQMSGCAGAGFDLISRMVQPILKGETEGRVPALFTGMKDVESARISVDLWELSRAAIHEGVAVALREPGFEPLAAGLPAGWLEAFSAFIARHGHRGLNEMEPAVPNWRADPAQVVATLRAYLDLPEEHSPAATLARQDAERLRLTRELASRMSWPRRRMFHSLLPRAQRWVAGRERTKSVVVRGTRLVDFYLPEMGRRLVEHGTIAEPGDLFFLTEGELHAALAGAEQRDLRAAITRRRRDFERNRYVRLPERFQGRPRPLPPEAHHAVGDVMTGTPVSPGAVTGRARVILDPRTDGPMEPGEILVAPVTDAGWTPLFALAAGLVVDLGSALSHGSTVAREYGLPAVVNVRRGTSSIRTGDLIAVDGRSGTVTVLEAAAGAGAE